MGHGLSRRQAACALGALFLLFFLAHLVSGGVPYYRDHLVTNIPLRAWVRERLLSGAMPHWYPYEALGVPVIGQVALATFHPFTFLFLPLSPPAAEKASLLAAYLVSLLGAYRLARAVGASREGALAGAAAYAFGGYSLGVSSILAYALSASAVPWVGWAMLQVARRGRLRDAGLLGLLWGTSLRVPGVFSHGGQAWRRPASRRTGAKSLISAGRAAPSGRHRARTRAATAATSGAASAARPSTCQPAVQRSGVGFAATAAATAASAA